MISMMMVELDDDIGVTCPCFHAGGVCSWVERPGALSVSDATGKTRRLTMPGCVFTERTQVRDVLQDHSRRHGVDGVYDDDVVYLLADTM